MDKGNVYYVYVYFLQNGIPCWVGKGSGDRYKAHLWGSGKNENKEFLEIRRGAKALGIELPVVIVRDELSHRDALRLEKILIDAIGCRRDETGPLVNYAKGTNHDPISREKMSLANLGKKRSPETREKLRQAKLGKHQSEAAVQKRSRWMSNSLWITDGVTDTRIVKGGPIPDGWRLGRYKGNLGGLKWITNGNANRRIREGVPVPEGWQFGYVADFTERSATRKRKAYR